MKILYIGDFLKRNGPSTVDISLKNEFEKLSNIKIIYLQSNTKLSMFALKSFLKSDLIHVSGVSFLGVIFSILAKIVGKKITFTMHGYLKIEAKFRNVKYYRIIFEKILIYISNKIFPVSSKLSNVVQHNYKSIPIPNGIQSEIYHNTTTDKNKLLITLIGGGRLEKRNYEVCKIINDIIIEKKLDLKVNIFGEYGEQTNKINEFNFVTNYGFCSKEMVIRSLGKSKIFIQYSLYEPFSLAVAEAISQHCCIITSKHIGINDYIEESKSFITVNDDEHLKKSIVNALDFKFDIKHNILSWEEVSQLYTFHWDLLV